MWFGLFRFRSPLLTESRLLSLPVGTEMFHFPTFPPHALCVQAWVTGHDSCRVSPFGNPRIKAQSAAPRGLSQPLTSFFGSWCQGIHRAPLLTWPQRCSRPLCSSQDAGGEPDPVSPRTSIRRPFGASRPAESRSRRRPIPQDPTVCPTGGEPDLAFHAANGSTCGGRRYAHGRIVSVPPMSTTRHGHPLWAWTIGVRRSPVAP